LLYEILFLTVKMQTFISEIIPKLQNFSKKLDDLTLLTNQHWVVLDELNNAKNVYIFRNNNELLISSNGKVEKAHWEYLGNNSLLIDRKDESLLFKHGFFDENVMALKIDGKEEYALLVNENRFNGELNSKDKVIAFLSNSYLDPIIQKQIGLSSKVESKVIELSEKEIEERKQTQRYADTLVLIMITIITIGIILAIL
jgi:hypothetical protein